jgi:nicotinamidase-related amidase
MPNVVLVVDMVRGFCEEGHNLYVGLTIRDIIPRIRELLREEKAKGSHFIFLCDTHDPDDLEFKMFPPHCVRGSEEAEVIPELQEFAEEMILKQRFSVVGVCTNICILYTVADARNRDYAVEVPADCVATFDAEAHKFALHQLRTVLGAQVTGAPVG